MGTAPSTASSPRSMRRRRGCRLHGRARSASRPSTRPASVYEDCAHFIGDRLERCGFEVEYFAAEGRPEHTRSHPRVNVVGTRHGRAPRPCRAPERPFRRRAGRRGLDASIRSAASSATGRIYGRGIVRHEGRASPRRCSRRRRSAAPASRCRARSRSAARWTKRAAASPASRGSREHGRIAQGRTDYVIIPEPLNVDRICIGHRGVYWFEVTTRGRIAHGSMPFLGVSAIEHMGRAARVGSARS